MLDPRPEWTGASTRPRSREGGGVWVLHRGALGDGVLLWPMLRALARCGPVTLVADGPRAALAARELGLTGLDAEAPALGRLWVAGGAVQAVPGVTSVHAYLGPQAVRSRVWTENARRMFPGAVVTAHALRPDAALARLWSCLPGGAAPAAVGGAGRVVLHVGAGGAPKCWPLAAWSALAAGLAAVVADAPPTVVAGEVERERHDALERAAFRQLDGRYLSDLAALADLLRDARLVVGADSGPAHLAAQLGVPTLVLFGPTRPERWAPVGPRVTVMAPPTPRPMTWLDPSLVLRAALDALRGPESG